MRSYRKFCIVFGIFFLLFLAGNAWVWFGYTRPLLTRQGGQLVGDLARMGYQATCIHPRSKVFDLPRRHLKAGDWKGEKVDMVTLGDSFSNGGAFGRNPFYQDFIASGDDLTVLNLPPLPDTANLIETVTVLLNSGYLRELGVRHVLLEMVERTCNSRLALPVDFDRTRPLADVRKFYAGRPIGVGGKSDLPKVGFLNTGNFKFLFYNFGYLISDNSLGSQVYRVRLDRPLFSGSNGDVLLFLDKDIEVRRYNDSAQTMALNDNVNQLARRLAAEGITLTFMPVVNKYTLYREYIPANPYPESQFFQTLRGLPREYRLIDTAAILGERLAAGEQDIFYIDDSHWTWKASQAIFSRERFAKDENPSLAGS